MQILKVLLVVLLVVNLSTGFFFKKKKKVIVHHPAPSYQPYAEPYPYSYNYYQSAPYSYDAGYSAPVAAPLPPAPIPQAPLLPALTPSLPPAPLPPAPLPPAPLPPVQYQPLPPAPLPPAPVASAPLAVAPLASPPLASAPLPSAPVAPVQFQALPPAPLPPTPVAQAQFQALPSAPAAPSHFQDLPPAPHSHATCQHSQQPSVQYQSDTSAAIRPPPVYKAPAALPSNHHVHAPQQSQWVPLPDKHYVPATTSQQALPAFEPAAFQDASQTFNTGANVEIVPSIGYQMGTTTDIIEIHKSEGQYIELPPEFIRTDDVGIAASPVTQVTGNIIPAVLDVPSTYSEVDVAPVIDVAQQQVSSSASSQADTASSYVENVGSLGSFDQVDVSDGQVQVTAAPVVSSFVSAQSSAQENSGLGIRLDEVPAVLNDANLASTNGEAFQATGNANAGVSEPVTTVLGTDAVNALSFPEVQELLHELVNNGDNQLSGEFVSNSGIRLFKSVEIDPQGGYSRVARQ